MRTASASATHAPVMEAVRVPPSAWTTSQSTWKVTSPPSASMSTTVRNERPIRRSISMLRPWRRPVSRGVRVPVEAGIIAYSAVTQPLPLPRRQPFTFSSMVTAHKTFVLPHSIRHEPGAVSSTWRRIVHGRFSAGPRP